MVRTIVAIDIKSRPMQLRFLYAITTIRVRSHLCWGFIIWICYIHHPHNEDAYKSIDPAVILLGEQLLDRSIANFALEIVVAADMGLGDKDVGHGSLSSLLQQVFLNIGTVVSLVKLVDSNVGNVEAVDGGFGCLAVRAIRLGKDGDFVAGNGRLYGHVSPLSRGR